MSVRAAVAAGARRSEIQSPGSVAARVVCIVSPPDVIRPVFVILFNTFSARSGQTGQDYSIAEEGELMKFQLMMGALTLASVVIVASPSLGVVLYSQDFNVDDTTNWNINNGPGDATVDFFYNYADIGVPAAPNGTGTRGLKMSANNSSQYLQRYYGFSDRPELYGCF